ncbi:hypothetical protein FYJ71_03535 [Peptostreptococcus anaerobius]|uniref:Uncharacterized protein n=1 Tax=Peptostreptococcus porci TaxID=2652282 RepID=A0A6N7XFD3_9FIRM|nr:hypothetical protein [Peptostreptococcus porci]MDY5963914.1 hypothetical protein [Peptostreptococcus porci]MDY6232458.1 hypothetical protein [Peptostreptococcus porci]MST62047.1 hypothetical protein [Peptostreptococcus porci]
MKKRLFTIGILVTGLALVSPISGAVNTNKKLNNANIKDDVMYVTVSDSNVVNSRESSNEAPELLDNQSSVVVQKVEEKVDKEYNNNDLGEKTTLKKTNKKTYRNVKYDKKAVNDVKNSVKNENIQNTASKSNNENAEATVEAKKIDSSVDSVPNNNEGTALTKSQALEALKSKNSSVDYNYMGDEKDFSVLKEKGHEGYVYLPDVPTDMGVFVDKNTKEMYYFHPSGYMDIYE